MRVSNSNLMIPITLRTKGIADYAKKTGRSKENGKIQDVKEEDEGGDT